MDFEQAITIINTALAQHRPAHWSSSWVAKHEPKAYRYIYKNLRTDLGDIDWDKVVCKLDGEFQKKWTRRRPKKVKPYRNIREVRVVLKRFENKLYVFISPLDDSDKLLRDTISIPLVRLAQKGNLRAQQELITLLKYIIDQWIEYCPRLWRWKGYSDEAEDRIKGCIRCYRFTGSFIGYLFRTFEYAGRGLVGPTYSLDEYIPGTDKRSIDNVVQDQDTNQILLWRR